MMIVGLVGAHSVLEPLTFWNFLQWLFQPIQGPGLLFSSVIIFHRR
jgi:hypothetical protein